VAILNRDQLEGYFVPASAVEVLHFEPTQSGEAVDKFKDRKQQLSETLKYLKDK